MSSTPAEASEVHGWVRFPVSPHDLENIFRPSTTNGIDEIARADEIKPILLILDSRAVEFLQVYGEV